MTIASTFNQRATAIAVAIQSARGTLATPTLSANAIPLLGTPPLLTPDYLEKNDRSVTTGRMGNAGGNPAPAGKFGKFTVTLEPKGLGTAPSSSTRPEIDPFMRMSKHAATFVASGAAFGATATGAAWEYTDSDAVDEVATVYFYSPGRLTILADCVATRKLGLVANKPGAETFEVSGRIVSIASATASGMVLSAIVPPIWNGNRVTFGGFTSDASTNGLVFQSAEIDEALAVSPLPSAGATDDSGTPNLSGIAGFYITDRAPSLKVVLAQPPLSVYNPLAEADDPNSAPARKFTALLGNMAAPGNRVVYSTGSIIPAQPSEGNVNGTMTWELNAKILDGSEPTGGRHTLLRVG